MFIGTEYYGIFKSTDGGINWDFIESGLPNDWNYVYSLSISPNFNTDGTIFAGLHYYGAYRSTDGGENWGYVGSEQTTVWSSAILPTYGDDHTVFIGHADYGGIYRSKNGGDYWVHLGKPNNEYIDAIRLSPNYSNDHTVYTLLSGWEESQIFKSTDEGDNWSQINFNGSENALSLALSPSYASDQTVFVGTSGQGVFKSQDGRATWATINNGLENVLNIRELSPSTNYINDNTIFAGTDMGVYSYSVPLTTAVSTNPASPDGENGWFVTTPVITLTTNKPATTYYSFDATSEMSTYAGPFNPPEGWHELFYYSVDGAGNTEAMKSTIIYVDTLTPENPTNATETNGAPDNTPQQTVSDPNFTWTGGTDYYPGIAGYYVYFGTDPNGTSNTWTGTSGYDPGGWAPERIT